MADLLTTFANAYRYNPNAAFEGAQNMQNLMTGALNFQQKREALEAQRSLKELYANNPQPSFEDLARINPEFAMQQQLSNVDLQGKMLGMQKTQGEISEQQKTAFARTVAPIAEEFASKQINPEVMAQFHGKIGNALAQFEQQTGIKPPPGFNVEQLSPESILMWAMPYYKSPTMENIAKAQGTRMEREIPRTEGGPYGTRLIQGIPTGMGVTGFAPPGVNQPQGAQGQMPADLMQIAQQAAATFGVDPNLVMRVMQVESGGNRGAVSPKGAIGPMQLMPDTAKELGVDPRDVQQNIYGGVRYLAQQLQKYKDPELALAAYNAGPGAVDRAGGVPNYPETQSYVNKITGGAGATGGFGGAPSASGIVTPADEMRMRAEEERVKAGIQAEAAGIRKTAETQAEKAAAASEQFSTLQALDKQNVHSLIDQSFTSRPEQFAKSVVGSEMLGMPSEANTATERLTVIAAQMRDMAKAIVGAGPISEGEQKIISKALGGIETAKDPESRKAAYDQFVALAMEKIKKYPHLQMQMNAIQDMSQSAAQSSAQPSAGRLRIGDVKSGYEYLGGNPNDQSSWRKSR